MYLLRFSSSSVSSISPNQTLSITTFFRLLSPKSLLRSTSKSNDCHHDQLLSARLSHTSGQLQHQSLLDSVHRIFCLSICTAVDQNSVGSNCHQNDPVEQQFLFRCGCVSRPKYPAHTTGRRNQFFSTRASPAASRLVCCLLRCLYTGLLRRT